MVTAIAGIVPLLRNQKHLLTPVTNNLELLRFASKKAGTSSRNQGSKARPKHRGWKVQDGHVVPAGKLLVTQLTTRFHPGLNVGIGRNGTLYAIEPGKVFVTCEKVDLDFNHAFVKKNYGGREDQVIYKKHFNVIPEPQHRRFVLKDLV